MRKIIYLGMQNTPHEVFETTFVKNYKVVYQYENNNGRKVMLKSTSDDNYAYHPPYDFKQIANKQLPPCKKGGLYPIDILDKGYSRHHFELVEL